MDGRPDCGARELYGNGDNGNKTYRGNGDDRKWW